MSLPTINLDFTVFNLRPLSVCEKDSIVDLLIKVHFYLPRLKGCLGSSNVGVDCNDCDKKYFAYLLKCTYLMWTSSDINFQ